MDSPLSTQNITWKNKDLPPPTRVKHGRPFTSWHASHWLHGHSIPKIGCHYFWPEFSTIPHAIIPYNLFVAWLHYMRTLACGQSTLYTKHNLKKTKTSHHPQEKKRDDPSLHGTLLIGCMDIQFLKLVATIFGLNSPPSHMQLFQITFLWHGSTTQETFTY